MVPLTSNTERIYPGEARVMVAGKESKAMADQIMTADKVRLKSRIDALSKADLNAVDLALRVCSLHYRFRKVQLTSLAE